MAVLLRHPHIERDVDARRDLERLHVAELPSLVSVGQAEQSQPPAEAAEVDDHIVVADVGNRIAAADETRLDTISISPALSRVGTVRDQDC